MLLRPSALQMLKNCFSDQVIWSSLGQTLRCQNLKLDFLKTQKDLEPITGCWFPANRQSKLLRNRSKLTILVSNTILKLKKFNNVMLHILKTIHGFFSLEIRRKEMLHAQRLTPPCHWKIAVSPGSPSKIIPLSRIRHTPWQSQWETKLWLPSNQSLNLWISAQDNCLPKVLWLSSPQMAPVTKLTSPSPSAITIRVPN